MSSQAQPAPLPDRDECNPSPDRRVLDEMFTRLYDRIRHLASRVRWTGSNPTLNPTALVHEAYLKLRRDPPNLISKSYEDVVHVFANVMRQILIDGARRKLAQKRVPSEMPERFDLPVEDALTLDAALDELERENPMQARIVECRFLLGMTADEAAAALGLSKRTLEREWQDAKCLLSERIQPVPEKNR